MWIGCVPGTELQENNICSSCYGRKVNADFNGICRNCLGNMTANKEHTICGNCCLI